MSGKLRPREELEEALRKIDKELQFKDAHLELFTDARFDDYIKFHKVHIHPDEVLGKSLGFNISDELQPVMKLFLHEKLSIFLISDKTDEVIAIRSIMLGKKSQPIDFTKIPDAKIGTMLKFSSHKNEEMDVYKRFNCDIAVEFPSLGTHRDFRRQGIASKLFKAAVMFSKELGLDPVCIKGDGTSNYAQKIYEKNGFEAIHTFRYDEYKVDGEVVFKNTGEHETMKVYVKKL